MADYSKNPWLFLKEITQNERVGYVFRTNLLGRVPYKLIERNGCAMQILAALQQTAEQYGFRVLGGDFTKNQYILIKEV